MNWTIKFTINDFLIYLLIFISFISYEYHLYRNYYELLIAVVLFLGMIISLKGFNTKKINVLVLKTVKKNWLVYVLAISLISSTMMTSLKYSSINLNGILSVILTVVSLYVFFLFFPLIITDFDNKLKKLANFICIFAFIGIVIYFRGNFMGYSLIYSRVASIFFDSNYFGTICSIGAVLSIKKNKITILPLIINLIGIYISGSRGAMISVLVTLVCSYIYKMRLNFKNILLVVVLITGIYYFLNFLYSANFFRVYQGLNSRDQLWEISLRLIKQSPLFGYGYGTVSQILRLEGALYGSSHNAFLDYILMYGVPSFIFNILIIATSIIKGIIFKVPFEIIMVAFVLLINSNTISINLGGLGITSLLLTIFLGVCNSYSMTNRIIIDELEESVQK